MSLGEKRFEEVESGRKYRLSDGTTLDFLGRGSDGTVDGVTMEELLTVCQARIDAMRNWKLSDGRLLSLAFTDLQSAENWLSRWEAVRAREREQRDERDEIVKLATR